MLEMPHISSRRQFYEHSQAMTLQLPNHAVVMLILDKHYCDDVGTTPAQGYQHSPIILRSASYLCWDAGEESIS